MPWYPSAKACPAAIKPTVQCFFPTLYQVLLLTFPLLGKSYFLPARLSPRNRAKRGAKTAGAQSEDVPLFTRRRTGGEWPYHQQVPRNRAKRGAKTARPCPLRPQAISAQPPQARCKNSRSAAERRDVPLFIAAQSREARRERRISGRNRRRRHWRDVPLFTAATGELRNRAKRGAKTAGAQSAAPAGAFRSATAAGGTWRGDRMFLCLPAAEQAANGWRRQPCPTAGGSSKPRTTANKLSPRRAKLALNVRIGCSCRAHNHHKFSHRFLQPHTKRRASHAD